MSVYFAIYHSVYTLVSIWNTYLRRRRTQYFLHKVVCTSAISSIIFPKLCAFGSALDHFRWYGARCKVDDHEN